MRIGYPCINLSLNCRSSRTFRIKSYSEERLINTIESNLNCLQQLLDFNVQHSLLFFRITSDLIPFASHPICAFPWQSFFRDRFEEIGKLIRGSNMRISMHPDQFTLINSPDLDVFERSQRELIYHAEVLDLMALDTSAKMQIHVGGVYNNKQESASRFIERYRQLDESVKQRLVIENDDKSYALWDCLSISEQSGIPVLFDYFHHKLNSSGETVGQAIDLVTKTWRDRDGPPMVDYSHSQQEKQHRAHADSLDPAKFREFLKETSPFDFDVMLEIKDKERSAITALGEAKGDPRLIDI